MACGQSFAAVRSGMAECTPNFRAAYDAAETTPRSSRCPPTTTGLPCSDGSNNSSTETKKASISTWKMVRGEVLIGVQSGLLKVYRENTLSRLPSRGYPPIFFALYSKIRTYVVKES